MLRFLKNWTLPVAIVVGAALYLLFAYVPALDSAAAVLGPVCETIFPVSVFATLFVTFSKVDFHLMRLRRWHGAVLFTQLAYIALMTWFIYESQHLTALPERVVLFDIFSLRDVIFVLEAVLTCVIAPCASASPVVTAKLGGDLTQMTTFVLLSSFVTSLLIPAVFPVIEPHQGATFLSAFLVILRKVAVVLLLPLLLGAIVRHGVKPLYEWIVRTPDLGFYCWCFSLAITAGITVKNIVHSRASLPLLVAIAVLSLLTALWQFRTGRFIGHRFGEPICAGQAMFQKNTALAIWVAYMYLTPVASIGAGCYVLWQNLLNSFELWQHRRHDAPAPCTTASPTAWKRSRRP